MPQTTGRPATILQDGGLDNAWSDPNNALTDNATNATAASTLDVIGTQQLQGRDFHLLAGEGTPFSGVSIPVGASIVGVRFHYDVITGGGAPHVLTLASTPGASTDPFAGTAQVVRTIGYGTLSTGSTVAGGNTWGANDLSTDAGSLAARASLADGTLLLSAEGGVGAVTGNATYGLDYFGVTVEWVLRVDKTGGSLSTLSCGGIKKPIVRKNGGALMTASAGAVRSLDQGKIGGVSGALTGGGAAFRVVRKDGGGRLTALAGGDRGGVIFLTGGGFLIAVGGADPSAVRTTLAVRFPRTRIVVTEIAPNMELEREPRAAAPQFIVYALVPHIKLERDPRTDAEPEFVEVRSRLELDPEVVP